jgi:hypothetical protein
MAGSQQPIFKRRYAPASMIVGRVRTAGAEAEAAAEFADEKFIHPVHEVSITPPPVP